MHPIDRPAPGAVRRPLEDDGPETRAAARGDPGAYRRLTRRYAGRLHGFATRMLDDAAEAEDVTQESFLRLWRALTLAPPRESAGAWLFRTARNLCIDRLRKRGRLVAESAGGADAADAVPDPTPTAEDTRATSDRQAAVRAALNALPERQRAAIALVHFEGLSGRDAAQVLAVSEEALESLLARGRRGLRDALAPRRAEL